jgi:hypothetical protein
MASASDERGSVVDVGRKTITSATSVHWFSLLEQRLNRARTESEQSALWGG